MSPKCKQCFTELFPSTTRLGHGMFQRLLLWMECSRVHQSMPMLYPIVTRQRFIPHFQTNPNWPYDWGIYANSNPIDLNTTAPLAIAEGQLIGCIVSTFSAFDPDVNASILFTLVDGNGSDSNHEFSLDTNGTLRTAVVFDYEGENSDNDPTLHVRVRARDEYNASVEQSFMVLHFGCE